MSLLPFSPQPRHDWTLEEVRHIMNLPFMELLYQAQTIHRANFDPSEVQVSTLLNVKTGGCSEDCSYCAQSARYDTGIEKEKMMSLEEVLAEAKAAKEKGATRFCMGAAWREPNAKQFIQVVEMVKGVKALGMEACTTLGMLNEDQAAQLKAAGLDYYNHNLDTSEAFYPQVITTRDFKDRLDTLERVRNQGMKVCSGGILGMGEEQGDRASLLHTYATMSEHPHSVPINMLIPIEGTPMAQIHQKVDALDFIRVIATARILLPKSYVRLSAGRTDMTDETQALCFFAGANSIFYGDKLLTANNPGRDHDQALLAKLGMHMAEGHAVSPMHLN